MPCFSAFCEDFWIPAGDFVPAAFAPFCCAVLRRCFFDIVLLLFVSKVALGRTAGRGNFGYVDDSVGNQVGRKLRMSKNGWVGFIWGWRYRGPARLCRALSWT